MVDVLLGVLQLGMEEGANAGLVVSERKTLGEDEDAMPRDVVLLESLANDPFRLSMRVDVRLELTDQPVLSVRDKLDSDIPCPMC